MTAGSPSRILTLLRLLAIQGSWNDRTLIGHGFAWTLTPMLRGTRWTDPDAVEEAVARNAEPFNSHPYLAGIAVGAVARAETDGAAPEVIARFKEVLRSPLGATGDALVWAGLLPACLMGAIVLGLLGGPVGWILAAFLVSFNAFHLWIRLWGLSVGWQHGLEAGSAVIRAGLRAHASRAIMLSTLMAGGIAGVLIADWGLPVATGPAWACAVGLAVLAGYRWGVSAARIAAIALALWTLTLGLGP